MPHLEERDGELHLTPLRFNPARCAVWIEQDEIGLTRRDVILVELLLRHIGRIITREDLIEAAWGDSFDGSARAVDVHLSRLRRRVFDHARCPVKVKSVRGVGYKVNLAHPAVGPRVVEMAWSQAGVLPRVLVVDDNPVTRTITARILSKLGCQVDIAADGREATVLVAQTPYCIIFMDIEMPHLDGCEATRVIRQDLDLAQSPVIVAMTAHCLPEDREKCWAVGMDDFLAKPIARQHLVAMLERWATPGAMAAHRIPDQPAIVDVNELWHLLDHDRVLLDEMLSAFGSDWLVMRQDMQEAIAGDHLGTLAGLVSRLIDSLLSFAAPRAIAAARLLQNMERFDDVTGVLTQYHALAAEIEVLQRELGQLRVGTAAAV